MRIAHVAPVIYPIPPNTYGGTERVVADLAVAQRALGHEVTVFGPADSTLSGIDFVGRYTSLSAQEHVRGASLPPGFPAQLEAEQLCDLVERANSFDVVHLHGSAHASGVCAALRVPTFRTIHWRADEPDHIQHFDSFPNERIIAISARQAQDVPAHCLAGVVHHGLPAERYRPAGKKGAYLAFIGRMTDQKRPDRAIELARALQMPLRLAGPVDLGNPTYFDEVVVPHLNENIVYVGSLTDAEKQDFLANSAALVFPIDWPEPFGLVMIEAMACGVPVIAWDNGSVREVVDNDVTGIVVNSVKEALGRWDKVRAIDAATIRHTFERHFSVDRMATAVLELYSETAP